MPGHKQQLNIIVCVDPRRCGHVPDDMGRTGPELLRGLQQTVDDHGWADKVQVTPCRCIFGCTYGPRLDAVNRTGGGKVLYGSTEGKATISRRGTVDFRRIPPDLTRLLRDNLGTE